MWKPPRGRPMASTSGTTVASASAATSATSSTRSSQEAAAPAAAARPVRRGGPGRARRRALPYPPPSSPVGGGSGSAAQLVAIAQRFVEGVGRHHRAAYARVGVLGGLAPQLPGPGVDRHHHQAALLHRLDVPVAAIAD